jgi:type I restriction enzyme M protein
LPQLAWLLFLKAFDDLEAERAIIESGYTPALPESLRWRSWVTDSDRTGDPLLSFAGDDLIPALRELRGSGKAGDTRDTLARVFQDVTNRMLSGHLLRSLLDQLDKISFSVSDDLHAMAVFYESMLREMRDAAGTGGFLAEAFAHATKMHPWPNAAGPHRGCAGLRRSRCRSCCAR